MQVRKELKQRHLKPSYFTIERKIQMFETLDTIDQCLHLTSLRIRYVLLQLSPFLASV